VEAVAALMAAEVWHCYVRIAMTAWYIGTAGGDDMSILWQWRNGMLIFGSSESFSTVSM
jgi:hypothetical protein